MALSRFATPCSPKCITPSPASIMTSLNSYIVPPEELACSEYCFKADVEYSKKAKDDHTVTDVLKIINALLNTCGGVVSVCGITSVDDKTLDRWKQAFDSLLQNKLTLLCYMKCVRFHIEHNTIQIIHCLVKKSPHIVTFDYSLYTRGSVGNIAVHDTATTVDILAPTLFRGCKRTLDMPNTLIYNTTLKMTEGCHIEFKCWKTSTFQELSKKLHDTRTQHALLAMPNLPSGGYVIIGIDEDETTGMLTIKGQVLAAEDEEHLIGAIGVLLTVDPTTGEPRIWGKVDKSPIRGKDWDVSFLPVQGCPTADRRVVIVIGIHSCQNGVFIKRPRSFVLSENGSVEEQSFNNWKLGLMKCADTGNGAYRCSRTHFIPPKIRKIEDSVACFSQEIMPPFTSVLDFGPPNEMMELADDESSSETGHVGVLVRTIQPTCDFYNPRAEDESTMEQSLMSTHPNLSWSQHNRNWQRNVIPDKTHIESTVHSVNEILSASHPLNIFPKLETVLDSRPEYSDDLKLCIDNIQNHHGKQKGFVFVGKDWIRTMSSENLESPPHHVLDIFSAAERGSMLLVSVYERGASEQDLLTQKAYVNLLARLIKLKVMMHPMHSIECGQSIYVRAQSWTLRGEKQTTKQQTYLDNVCDRFLSQSENYFKSVETTLGMLFLTRDTPLKRNIGDQCLLRLTMQQMKVILNSDITQFNLIEGPPGSGKTILALEVSRKYKYTDCLIMVKNPCLQAFLDFQGLCLTKLITKDQDLVSIAQREDFEKLRCLIIDDSHTLSFKESTWEQFFQTIKKTKKVLYLLMDSVFQNFQNSQATSVKCIIHRFIERDEFVSYQEMKLNKVHRNTQKVAGFIAAGFDIQVRCGHDVQGDDVELQRVDFLESPDANNGLLLYVKELFSPRKDNAMPAYDVREIAILVDGKNAETDIARYTSLFKRHLPNIKIQGADKYPIEGIIIDHLDHFAGLEAKVCVLVAPDIHSKSDASDIPERHFSNPKYKAFVASRGIYKVVFVTDSDIDFTKVDRMYIDRSEMIKQIKHKFPDYSTVKVQTASVNKVGGLSNIIHMCDFTEEAIVIDNTQTLLRVQYREQPAVVRKIGEGHPSDVVQLTLVGGMAIDSRGQVYISEKLRNHIIVRTFSGQNVNVIGQRGRGEKQFIRPSGIAFDKNDNLYVCDSGNNRVQVLTSGGEFISMFNLPDPDLKPVHIAVSKDRVAVTDRNGGVHLLTLDGSHLRNLKEAILELSSGAFRTAGGVVIDEHGHVIVSDPESGCLYVVRINLPEKPSCSQEGKRGASSRANTPGWIITGKTESGAVEMKGATGLALANDGSIVVCNSGRCCIHVCLVSKLSKRNMSVHDYIVW